MGDHFRMGAESCRWIKIQAVALFYPKCAISQNMKSQRSISNELQYNAKQDLILISNNVFDTLAFQCFFVTGMVIPQIEFGFFWPLNNRFRFLLASF